MLKNKGKWVLIFCFLLILGYLLYNIFDIMLKIDAKEKEKEELENRIEIEMKKNQELKIEQELIKSFDEEYLENKARKELGMIKEGEIIFEDRNKD